MKNPTILDEKQKSFLKSFSKEKGLLDKFYLSGGTALAEYYIPYRLSEDLDFFSLNEVSPEGIITFLEKNKERLGFDKFEFNTSFNRNLFFLHYDGYILKTEFTYFPFTNIDNPKEKSGIKIDSIVDIAANKLFTIYQKPRSRDFTDLYMICNKYDLKIEKLIKEARIKFDTVIDPIKLGSQFLLCRELKDYPRLLIELPDNAWQDFFLSEAKKLGTRILK